MRLLVNIDVPEIEPAVRFYTCALELWLSRMVSADVAELTGATATVYLLRNAAASNALQAGVAPRRYERHWTPVHVDFVVDDIAQSAQRAVQAGAIQETGCVCWNGSKCITFADPFGHGFCLIEFEQETYSGNEA